MNLAWRHFLVMKPLLGETERLIRSFWKGDEPREGFVYWGGRRAGKDVVALTAFAPDACADELAIETSEEANTVFLRRLRELELTHVAQVHSHPALVEGHSWGDDLWAFMKYPGLVSIVAQDYGRQPLWPFSAVYVHAETGFERLDPATVKERFVLVPSACDLRRAR